MPALPGLRELTQLPERRSGPPANAKVMGVQMPEGDVEVVYNSGDGKWRIRIEAHEILDGDYDKKSAAVEIAREEAQDRRDELIIKNQDGTIAVRDSHGHDPRDIPG